MRRLKVNSGETFQNVPPLFSHVYLSVTVFDAYNSSIVKLKKRAEGRHFLKECRPWAVLSFFRLCRKAVRFAGKLKFTG